MGMFDYVIANCPICGGTINMQSKGGHCVLDSYFIDNCPPEVMTDLPRNNPWQCDECGAEFNVEVQTNYRLVKAK